MSRCTPRWSWPPPARGVWRCWRRSASRPDRVVSPDIDETPQPDELPRALCAAAGARQGRRGRRCRLLRAGRRHRGGRGPAHPAEGRDRGAGATLPGIAVRPAAPRASPRSCCAPRRAAAANGWCESVVAFARLTERAGRAYLASGEWHGKAGGYAIQGRAAALSDSCPAAIPTSSGCRCSRRRSCCADSAGRCRDVRILGAASPGEVRVAACRMATCWITRIWRPGAPGRRRRYPPWPGDGTGAAMAGAFVALDGSRGIPAGQRRRRGCHRGRYPGRAHHPRRAGWQGAAADGAAGARSGPSAPAAARLPGSRVVPVRCWNWREHHPEATVWLDDAGLAARLRPMLGERLCRRAKAFDDDVEERVEALEPKSWICPAVRDCISTRRRRWWRSTWMPAAATAAREGKAVAQLAVNRAVVPALARQIRLRNLSGAILVDFAGLPSRRRPALGTGLAAALAEDPLRPRLLGFTALGLAEIVRPRVHPPLHELLAGPHAAGLAALRRDRDPCGGVPAPARRHFARHLRSWRAAGGRRRPCRTLRAGPGVP